MQIPMNPVNPAWLAISLVLATGTLEGAQIEQKPAVISHQTQEAEIAQAPNRNEKLLIQQCLHNRGFDPGAADGLLGAQTRQALRQWQAKYGYPQTGELTDPNQQAMLIDCRTPVKKANVVPAAGAASTAVVIAAKVQTPESPPALSRKDKLLVQRCLSKERFNPGFADGLFGPQTHKALREWQAMHGYPQTGELTDLDQRALLLDCRTQTIEKKGGNGGPTALYTGIGLAAAAIASRDDEDPTPAPAEAPIFTSSAPYFLHVMEESTGSIGDPVIAIDPDGGKVTYNLSCSDSNFFRIDPDNGQLLVPLNILLDYETKSSYECTVTAIDSDGLTSSRNISLRIVDRNEPPEFTPSTTYELSIEENSSGEIEPVTADDPENEAITYELAGTDAAAFSIVRDKGILSIAAGTTLDFETKRNYAFSVIAEDERGALASRAVSLTITDVNEAPEFETSETYALDVAENSTGNVGDPMTADDPEGQALIYSLSGTDAAAFNVSDTGQLSLASSTTLDYEIKRNYSLSVIATERDGTDKLTTSRAVLLTVTDVNEAPEFETSTTYALDMAEHSTGNIGNPVTATDPEGQVLLYSLSGTDANAFNVSDRGQLSLAAGTTLDHETQSSYSFSVTATERDGTVKLTVSRAVLLTIIDVNEAPEFETSATYALDVAENSTGNIGDPVTADDPENRLLAYSLSGTDKAAFNVSDTGQLSLATSATLDHEIKRSYSFSVIATEQEGTDKFAVSRAILLTVTDVDEPPVFETSATYVLNVAENFTGNIGNPVTANDPEGETLLYSLSGTDAAAFNVNNKGQLSLAAGTTLDHETQSSYSFSVTATDQDGTVKLTASRAVLLTVTNINEPPEFGISATYEPDVAEHSTGNIGAPVTATDPENRPLAYSLSGTDAADFNISDTGQLSLATSASLDHETKHSYSFSVIATERDGTDKLTASRAVLLTVTDVNEAPEFATSATYALDVEENSSGDIGNPVIADDPEGETLLYSLSGTDATAFDISSTGQLSVSTGTTLDYETKRSYSFSVTATEQEGADRFAATQAVSLTITDVDEPPVFNPSTIYDLSVPENSTGQIGNPVTADDPEREKISYTLSGTDAAAFTISGKGQLSLAAGTTLDYETKRSYSFSVIATEEGTHGLTATRDVSLTVTDGNDAPAFTSSTTYELEVAENSSGQIGNPVTANDPNGDALLYSLSGTDATAFNVSDTGQLSLAIDTTLDYETKRSYSFSVTATERDGTDRFAASRAVLLTVTDINEAPVFNPSTDYELSVAENSTGNIGDPVTATDPENRPLVYSLSRHRCHSLRHQ